MIEDGFDGAVALGDVKLIGFEEIKALFQLLRDLSGREHAHP
jgi:hypothetical protein